MSSPAARHDHEFVSSFASQRAPLRRALLLLGGMIGSAAFASGCADGALLIPGMSSSEEEPVEEPGSFEAAPPGVTPDPSKPASPPVTDATPTTPVESVEPSLPSGGSAGGPSTPTDVDGVKLRDWSPPPPLRNSVTLADVDLAREALALLGSSAVGAEGSCSNCHSLGRPTLTRWQGLTAEFSAACLGATAFADVPAVDTMVGCFEAHAAPETSFSPPNFGIYAAAAHLPWFTFVFDHATKYAANAEAEHQSFRAHVGMPRAGEVWTQAQFDVVAEWFARGLPGLFGLIPEESGEDCTPGLDPILQTHVAAMASSGWRARNEQVPLLMFGCQSGQVGAECLSSVPLAAQQPFGAGWDVPGSSIRVLFDNTGASSNYWSRSSADGRFIASGLRTASEAGYDGQFIDLQQGRLIEGDFGFDPTFFPDNSGFLVQRAGYSAATGPTDGSANPGDTAVICNQSVLAGDPDVITGDEGDCGVLSGQIGLYQQLAKSVDGEDYWVVYGSFDEDNGGFSATLENPSAAFDSKSKTTLTPMLNTGTGFEPGEPTRWVTPLQGDPMLSPSGRLLVTRLKGREYTTRVGNTDVVKAEQSGYALHLVTTTQTGGKLSATLTDLGRICEQGGKAVISYDERWMVFHHYVTAADAVALGFTGPDDPAFAPYLDLGASNITLVDLRDGSSRIITHMGAGQYAMFPHFRSDGWLYFVVRTLAGEEWFAATDAALQAELTPN